MVSFVAWQERPGIDCHRLLVVELDLDEDCINNHPRLAGVGTLVFIGGGICITCEHLVSVEVFLSFFGSQDQCNAAPKKLQIKLAVPHFTGVAAFSVVQRSEMVGTSSAALSKGNYQAHKYFKHFSLARFTLESKKSSFHCAGSAVNSVDRPVLKVKDNVLFIREVGVLEVMYIVNTIHPNQDRNRKTWAVL